MVGIERCRDGSGRVASQVGECLITFDKVAVEVVRLASGGAWDGAFVLVFQEVTDCADITKAVCVLRGKRQGGEESQIGGVGVAGDVGAEKVGISGSEGVSQVGRDHLQRRAGLAVGFDFIFRPPPEARGPLDDI